jgi:hypothetical protein
MRKLLPTLMVILLLSGINCKKQSTNIPDPTLPEATQTGANTFGCKVDGKLYLPKKSSFSSVSPLLVNNSHFNGFLVEADYVGFPSELNYTVTLALPYFISTVGVFDLKYFPFGEYAINTAPERTYRTNYVYSGQLTITRCDTLHQIYSGTFYFTGLDTASGKTVQVTDGRFDLKD